MGAALASATRGARARAGLPVDEDPNSALGKHLGASQFDEGGAAIFRRTGLGGAANLNKLLGWEGREARAAAGIEEEEEVVNDDEQVGAPRLVRKLTVGKDPYKRNANAGPKLAVQTSVPPELADAGDLNDRELLDAANDVDGVGGGGGGSSSSSASLQPRSPVTPPLGGSLSKW
jgi:hypothetical protein